MPLGRPRGRFRARIRPFREVRNQIRCRKATAPNAVSSSLFRCAPRPSLSSGRALSRHQDSGWQLSTRPLPGHGSRDCRRIVDRRAIDPKQLTLAFEADRRMVKVDRFPVLCRTHSRRCRIGKLPAINLSAGTVGLGIALDGLVR